MCTIRNRLYPRIYSLLQQRETDLRRILGAEGAALHQFATGSAEVTDFKEAAAGEALAVVEGVQAEHAAVELSQVLAARRRLDGGSYGTCLECGDPIEEARLLALPSTSLCTSCQTLREQLPAWRHRTLFSRERIFK